MRNTGDRLKECRIMKGLSRGEMSEMLNVSTDYLARLETGTQPVTYRIIEKVAKLEGWNSDYILHGIDNNNPFSGQTPGEHISFHYTGVRIKMQCTRRESLVSVRKMPIHVYSCIPVYRSCIVQKIHLKNK